MREQIKMGKKNVTHLSLLGHMWSSLCLISSEASLIVGSFHFSKPQLPRVEGKKIQDKKKTGLNLLSVTPASLEQFII